MLGDTGHSFVQNYLVRGSSLWTARRDVRVNMAMASSSGMMLLVSPSQSVGITRSTALFSRQHRSAHGRSFRVLNLQVRKLGSVNARRELREQGRFCGVAASAGAGGLPLEGPVDGDSELEVSPPGDTSPQEQEEQRKSLTSWWKNWQTNASEMRAQVAKLGLAAVLAYGLFDGVTYTSFFVLAFLGYEKSTGQNPAANLKALLGVVVLMWTGNNVTRPLRVAGAAALAPLIDRFLKKTQKVLKLPNQAFAFMIVVASFASLCFSVVGVLILSRWGK
ncbi:hypothetical protein M758_5G044900 [Ceratodon purpureus]|nr:hypothetical protein M758_5G044900 [Ceratodon purpureus]